MAASEFTMRDGAYSCSASLYKGEGIIVKGILKKKFLDFVVDVNLKKDGSYCPMSDDSYILVPCRDNSVKKMKFNDTRSHFELPVSKLNLPNLTVTVVVVVPLGRGKKKMMKITLSNNF